MTVAAAVIPAGMVAREVARLAAIPDGKWYVRPTPQGAELVTDAVDGDALAAAVAAYDPANIPRDPAQVFAAAVAAGIRIVSTGTPALSGTYAIDPAATANIAGIAAGIAARNRVPGGRATFEYPEASGAPKTFTAAQFLDFASAVEDFVYGLSRGETPAQPVTIP